MDDAIVAACVGDGDGGDEAFDRAPPDPALWARLPDDVFAQVVIHARRGLHKLDKVHSTPEVKRLKAIPTPKLARGRGRERLLSAMGRGGPIWLAVRTRLETDPDLLITITKSLDSLRNGHRDEGEQTGRDRRRVEEEQRDNAIAQLRSQRDEATSQRDQVRRERDAARSQRDGAVGREAGLRTRIGELEQESTELKADVKALTAHAADHEERTRQAVERERRRGVAQLQDMEHDLAAARRELDHARRELRRAERAVSNARTFQPSPSTSQSSAVGGAAAVGSDDDLVVPGRPSRLPARVRLDTREGAMELLAPGRRVLVDGYNVTRSHKPELTLEQQRRWLTNGLASLATRNRVDVTVIFDAHVEGAPGGRGRAGRRRGVAVVYSMPGITADDELVLAVEALPTDVPVIVVTDDRELRGRLKALGVDLLHTTALVWVL